MSHPIEERFSQRPDVIEAKRPITAAVRRFGADVAKIAPTQYDGILFAAGDPKHKTAGVLVIEEPPTGYSDERRKFVEMTLLDRRIEYGGASLEYAFTDTDAQFTNSRMREEHVNWGAPVATLGEAAIQIAFDKRRGDMSLQNDMNALWKVHKPLINEAYTPLRRIQNKTEDFLVKLELKRAVQPTAFVIRWDIVGSTEMSRRHEGVYDAYRVHLDTAFETIMKRTPHLEDEQGDGQNLLIPILREAMFNPGSQRVILNTSVLPLVHTLRSTHDTIAALYPELNSRVRFGVAMGNTFPDHKDNQTGSPFHDAAEEIKKQKEGETLSLAPSVMDLLASR